jgi:hypothetical protein
MLAWIDRHAGAFLLLALLGISALGYNAHLQQLALSKSVRESAATRITTVSQRCELTSILLLDPHSVAVTARYEQSLGKCEVQLVTVRRIYARL